MGSPDRNADTQIFNAFTSFLLGSSDSAVGAFQHNLSNWGSRWKPVEPSHGVASDHLASTIDSTFADAIPVVTQFVAHRASRQWEQTYSATDGVVGDDMLASYGFAEIVGPRGPFVSTNIRGGIGLYGPNMTYPLHRHGPDEVYVVVSGTARFTVDGAVSSRGPGDVVHVPSLTEHGFTTNGAPLVVLYLWQNGSLRETSTFE